MTEEERESFILYIAANPMSGDIMEGTGGARKIRWSGRGKGKSGGVRVITYFAGPDIPVFLLTVSGKGEKANLTKAECNELKRTLGALAREYKGSSNVQGRRKDPKRR